MEDGHERARAMSIGRVCCFLKRALEGRQVLPISALADVPSHLQECHKSEKPSLLAEPCREDEGWQDFNTLSTTSTRASAFDETPTTQCGDFFDELPCSVQPRSDVLQPVELCDGLLFYDPLAPDDSEEKQLLVARRLDAMFDVHGICSSVRVVGSRRFRCGCLQICIAGEHDRVQSPNPQVACSGNFCNTSSEVAIASPGDLLVDVRIDQEDEPCLVPLLGARLAAGSLRNLRVCLAADGPFCEVGDGEAAWIPVAEAVSGLRQLQVKKHNVQLQAYQRQLCSRLMSAQRIRSLGLEVQTLR